MRLLFGLVAACLLLASPALAERGGKSVIPPLASPKAQAQFQEALALYSRGVSLVKDGRISEGQALLDQSIASLRAVIAVEPHAWVYYSLGQALRQRGDCEAAVVAYRAALARAPDEPLPERGKLEFIDRTKQQIGACFVERPTPPPPSPTAPSPAPSPAPTPIAAEIATSPQRPVSRTRYSVALPATFAGLTVAALAAGGALYGVSGGRYDALVGDGCGQLRPCDPSEWRGIQTMERAGIGLFIAGGTLAAIDVALWAAWRRR